MKKRLPAILLCLVLLLGTAVPGAQAYGMESFQKTRTYSGEFTDIAGKWYEQNAVGAFEYGLTDGRGNGQFAGDANVTFGEVVTMAARANATYYGETIPEADGAWYQRYVNYGIRVGIIENDEYVQFNDYTLDATRQTLAEMIYAALPQEAFEEINTISPGAIPDVSGDEAVYALYRAGILTGYEDGSFAPESKISRAEAFTILSRVVDPGLRVHFTLESAGASADVQNFVYHNAQGVIGCILTLYPEVEEFHIELVEEKRVGGTTSTITGIATGRYKAGQNLLMFHITDRALGTVTGGGLAQFSCRYGGTESTLIFSGGVGYAGGFVVVNQFGPLTMGAELNLVIA